MQHVGVKFYTCNTVAQKMYNIKLSGTHLTACCSWWCKWSPNSWKCLTSGEQIFKYCCEATAWKITSMRRKVSCSCITHTSRDLSPRVRYSVSSDVVVTQASLICYLRQACEEQWNKHFFFVLGYAGQFHTEDLHCATYARKKYDVCRRKFGIRFPFLSDPTKSSIR
jgi:hypothetical protein